jgi:hypothetical protein
MRRFLDRLASLPILFISGACEAQMIMAPCELPIAAMASVHFEHHSIKHVRHVAHRGAHRRTPHSFHLVTAGALCPISLDEGETNGLADSYARDFGADSAFGGGWGGGGEGGEGGGFGGGGEGDSDAQPIFLVDAPALAPIGPITPPECCGPPIISPSSPVPELSTWAMLIAGLAAIGFLKLRRASP